MPEDQHAITLQEHLRATRPGDAMVSRLQLTRRMTGGELHAWLLTA